MIIKHAFMYVLALSLAVLPITSRAADSGISLSKDVGGSKGNEFISGDYPGAVMVRINLWGGIQKPGIHYVPAKTDLITLLSYAGGPTDKAKMDDVIVKRNIGGKESIIEVDVERVLRNTKNNGPILEANDIVIIPTKSPIFSENSVQVIGIVASLLSIALASLILQKEFLK